MENRTSFGLDAPSYREFRPVYPEALYEYLAGLCTDRDAALDCATGNGQAATALARYFTRVVATDTDAAQLESAIAHPRVEYVVAAAEELPASLGSFNLVTVAQGAHWFDLPTFYARLRSLLAPGAVVAIWGYSYCSIDPAIDALVAEHLISAVNPYWAQGNHVIVDRYRSIPFPFEEIEAPAFAIEQRWDRDFFFGFVRTWSAHRRLLATGHADPLLSLGERLDAAGTWPHAALLNVKFELHMRIGRVQSGTSAN